MSLLPYPDSRFSDHYIVVSQSLPHARQGDPHHSYSVLGPFVLQAQQKDSSVLPCPTVHQFTKVLIIRNEKAIIRDCTIQDILVVCHRHAFGHRDGIVPFLTQAGYNRRPCTLVHQEPHA